MYRAGWKEVFTILAIIFWFTSAVIALIAGMVVVGNAFGPPGILGAMSALAIVFTVIARRL